MQNYSSKFKITKALIVLFFTFIFSFLTFNHSFAQSPTSSPLIPSTAIPASGINLSLSPTFLTVRSDPGKSISSEFKVRNNNALPEYLKISLLKFESNAQGNSVLTDITDNDEFAKWVEFDTPEFVVSPSQTKTVKFTISPPKEASLGYYYGIQVSRIKEAKGKPGTSVTGSVVLPVLLEVKSPNAKKEVQITKFTTNLFYEYLPVNFNVTFKNTGNVHTAPVGDIFIDSMINKDIAAIPVNEGRGNILPNGTRTYTATWDQGFAVRVKKTKDGVPVKNDKGEEVWETKYDFTKANEFRFGRYTAHLLMVYDNGERDIPVEATVSFWVIPWKILGVASVIVLLALVGLRSVFTPVIRRVRGR